MSRDALPPGASTEVIRSSRVLAWARIGPDGTLLDGNRTLAHLVGIPEGELPGRPFEALLADDDRESVRRTLAEEVPPGPGERFLANFVSVRHEVHTLRCALFADGADRVLVGEPDVEEDRAVAEELLRLNNELSVLSRENIRRSRELEAARGDLEATLEELESSYWHLRKIQEVLPLCMGCGKMKTGTSEWTSLVDYLKEHEIFVSHGYCPSCAAAFEREAGG
jgi:PAS domain-containing protein